MYVKGTFGVSLSPEELAFCFAKVPENSKQIYGIIQMEVQS